MKQVGAIYKNETMGILFRTFSQLDLEQLLYVFYAINSHQKKLDKLDSESILCTYEGHTIFSIFWD